MNTMLSDDIPLILNGLSKQRKNKKRLYTQKILNAPDLHNVVQSSSYSISLSTFSGQTLDVLVFPRNLAHV
jgi:uncharacterized protein (UPF0276 family)